MEEFPQSRVTYHSNEESNLKNFVKIWRIRAIFLTLTYGPSAIYPILYALIGTPTLDQWKLALPMKWVIQFSAFIILIISFQSILSNQYYRWILCGSVWTICCHVYLHLLVFRVYSILYRIMFLYKCVCDWFIGYNHRLQFSSSIARNY